MATQTGTGIGEVLRAAREERGDSPEDVARLTGISPDRVAALEAEAFERFNGHVYAKGFLKTYARHLGLDPTPLLDVYREAHEAGAPRNVVAGPVGQVSLGRGFDLARLSWVAWALVGAAVVVAVVLVANAFGGRTPAVAPQGPSSPPQAVSETTDDVVTPVDPEPEPEPVVEPTFEGVELVLLFDADCWVEVTVDGSVTEPGRVIPAGGNLTLTADDAIQVRFGNAGAVRATVNDQPADVLGAQGEVRTVVFTRDGVQDPGSQA